MTAVITIHKSGPHSSIQDKGRPGYQAFGVPEGGALDRDAMCLANYLVGNSDNAAGIETCLGHLVFTTSHPVLIALGGSTEDVLILTDDTGQQVPIPSGQSAWLMPHHTATLDFLRHSNSAFIAFGGDFILDTVFGSPATSANAQLGGIDGRMLKDGDKLNFMPNTASLSQKKLARQDAFAKHYVLHVVLGPQQDWFTAQAIDLFLTSSWRLTSKMNRMGVRLAGPKLEHKVKADILSDGIVCGSVQVPADGQPIIMLNDHQTTGGYTKIATLISSDLPKMARLSAGDKIEFVSLTQQEAEQKARTHAIWLQAQKDMITSVTDEKEE